MIKTVEVYDNNGESFDRYTVIINDAVYGMSSNPKSPQGFNQYCCQATELARDTLGKRVDVDTLPEEVQHAIRERIEAEENEIEMEEEPKEEFVLNLMDNFNDAFRSDGDGFDGFIKLINDYNNSSESEKALIDTVLIDLCGYSLKTLMERAKGAQ